MTIKMKVANTGFHFCRKNYKGYNETPSERKLKCSPIS